MTSAAGILDWLRGQELEMTALLVAVKDDHLVGGEVEFGGGFVPVVGDVDSHPLVAEAFRDRVRECWHVLNDQNSHPVPPTGGTCVAQGRVIWTRSPPSGRAWRSSVAPWAAATAATIESPKMGRA